MQFTWVLAVLQHDASWSIASMASVRCSVAMYCMRLRSLPLLCGQLGNEGFARSGSW